MSIQDIGYHCKNVIYIPVPCIQHLRESFNYVFFKKLMSNFAKNGERGLPIASPDFYLCKIDWASNE